MPFLLFQWNGYFIEDPRSKLRGIFDRKDFLSVFISLAHSAASPPRRTFGVIALAVSVPTA
jgi:hypothetical protein